MIFKATLLSSLCTYQLLFYTLEKPNIISEFYSTKGKEPSETEMILAPYKSVKFKDPFRKYLSFWQLSGLEPEEPVISVLDKNYWLEYSERELWQGWKEGLKSNGNMRKQTNKQKKRQRKWGLIQAWQPISYCALGVVIIHIKFC